MKKKNDVEVLIDGRKYTLCGFESPEYIQKIASYINRKLAEFHKQEGYARLDLDLRNTLLAINIADDYYKEKKKAPHRDSVKRQNGVRHEARDY